MVPGYAELHCLTCYSFLRGASGPEELVHRAVELGYRALAITDECSVAGVVRAHVAAKEAGLELIVGSEFTLVDGVKLVLLATSLRGYETLCETITLARRAAPKGEYRLARTDIPARPAGLLALWIPAGAASADGDEALATARWVAEHFRGNAWLAVELHRGANDAGRIEMLEALARKAGLPCVAAGDVHMHVRERKRLQDVMSAIRLQCPLQAAGRRLQPNSERYLRTIGRLSNIHPARLLAATLDVASRCTFSLDEIRYEYPQELVPAGQTPTTHLRKLTFAGLERRYPAGAPAAVVETVEHELRLIEELAYEPFFLTVQDIVAFARSKDILCQGRGSAANSAVCYCLGITEVDPGRMSVLFERFISKERNEPPDIDVDFEHQRREEVIQYIYGKYGRERAAITAVVITYQPRSALRDVGKALGLSLDQVDMLAKSMSWWDNRAALEKRLADSGFDLASDVIRQVIDITQELVGFPRHLSQHPGGFVIDNRRLSRLVPVENATMPGRTVIQWDKDDLDALGLLKVDVLGLGMLSCIRRAIDLVNGYKAQGAGRKAQEESGNARAAGVNAQEENQGGLSPAPCALSLAPLSLSNIPPEDPRVYDMICRADTIGVFQIESRAQMSMLPRLKPREFYDLVIEVAIVRPGPITGRMVHPYLRRREGKEPVTYASPEVRSVLERTLGVSIFQEQVMQLAVVAAGFTAGEADQLRRAMAAWRRRGGIEPFREKLVNGMLQRGYTKEFAEQIYQQIQGFGEYGFPESHAASFALLVYVSSWLKCHEPAAFAAALLNSQPMGFYSPSSIVQDAKRHGVELRPVDVQVSDVDCSLEVNADAPPALRLGLAMVKGLKVESARRLVAARANGAFISTEDLARRAQLDRGDLSALAAADALASLAGHRREALWETLAVDEPTRLGMPAVQVAPPPLAVPTEGEEIVGDYDTLGLTLRRHPLALLRSRLDRKNIRTAHDIANARHGQLVRTAGIVTCRQRPATASGVIFVTLEDETGYVNLVVWNDLADKQRRELLAAKLLGVSGQVQREGLVVHVLARRLEDLSPMLGRLATSSHDFH
ncbi:MAG TPA: error-prone DNA polymerase [Usitatibacter sp.]|nr:error-prone DNA polymerase [Usitatibacter sp.]